MSDSQKQDCQAAAIRLLSRREHSKKELKRKLLERDYDPQIIDHTLLALQGDNLQSDQRFAECYVRSKAYKGIGPVRLRRDLREHEISDEMIDSYLCGHEWRQLAVEVRQKRFGLLLPLGYEECAKQMRFLQYRGFSTEQVNAAIRHDNWESNE